MQISNTITKISEALLKAQSEMDGVKKTSSNPFFKSKYADLTSIIEVVKPILNKNGIAILQPHAGNVVETILLHSSGEFIGSSTAIICAKPNDPQALGSAISYARRYGLQSLVSLPAEDDDGNLASNISETKSQPKVSNISKGKDF